MSQLLDVTIDTKVKLFALWASILFCLSYSHHFGLFTPGTFEALRAFRADPEQRDILRATLLMQASPILMIFLSVALPAKCNRILNIVVGMLFILASTIFIFMSSMLLAASDVPIPLSAVRILQIAAATFAALVVWYAWKWPKAFGAGD